LAWLESLKASGKRRPSFVGILGHILNHQLANEVVKAAQVVDQWVEIKHYDEGGE
jgi:hypothetical protein